MPKTADLLEEIAALKAMLIAEEARGKRKDERIARLEKLVAAFKQAVFGRKSEKSDPDQFELALEDLETAMAVIHAEEDAEDRAAKRPAKPRAANRGSLPKHLPRIEEVIEPEGLICACGGCLHCIGEEGEAITPLVRVMAERTARHHPRPIPRHRHPSSEVCLPVLH
jgi:transposase